MQTLLQDGLEALVATPLVHLHYAHLLTEPCAALKAASAPCSLLLACIALFRLAIALDLRLGLVAVDEVAHGHVKSVEKSPQFRVLAVVTLHVLRFRKVFHLQLE